METKWLPAIFENSGGVKRDISKEKICLSVFQILGEIQDFESRRLGMILGYFARHISLLQLDISKIINLYRLMASFLNFSIYLTNNKIGGVVALYIVYTLYNRLSGRYPVVWRIFLFQF